MLSESICIADDRKSTLRGYIKKLKTMFSFTIEIHIFSPVVQLATVLQNPKFCASDSIKAVDTLKKTLTSFRTNNYFENILNTVNLHAEICILEPLDDTRSIQKTPKRLQYTNNPPTK